MSDKKKSEELQEVGNVLPTSEEARQVIYLGYPVLEKDDSGSTVFSMNYGTVFSNGLPEVVEEKCKSDADFAKMFVPVGEAGATMRQLSDPDSEFSIARGRLRRKA